MSNTLFPRQYAASRLIFHRGKGCHLFDSKGNRYLDFGSGIAVNSLGYGDTKLPRIAARQMKKLIHISNLYLTQPAINLAQLLLDIIPGDFSAVHFSNSGTEAIEAAIKYARLSAQQKNTDKYHLLSFENCFHGRTMGALSLNSKKKYRTKFEPLLPGCKTIPFNKLNTLKKTLNASFAAVITEVIQGEGGLESMRPEFAQALRELCTEHQILLIADEIQTGLGRSGSLLASSTVNLQPDIITLSKPLAGGLPLAATLIPEKVNAQLSLGDHGSTFGGGPVTCAVASEVVKRIAEPAFQAQIAKSSQILEGHLQDLHRKSTRVEELRGRGLLRGLLLTSTQFRDQVVHTAEREKLLVLPSGERTLRIAPPLTISPAEIRQGLAILRKIILTIPL